MTSVVGIGQCEDVVAPIWLLCTCFNQL